jgi:hypothetical protein
MIAGLGFFHYLLWGHWMSQDLAEEKAQEAAVERERDMLVEQLRRRGH